MTLVRFRRTSASSSRRPTVRPKHGRRRPLGDKLQVLASVSPESLTIVEALVDRILKGLNNVPPKTITVVVLLMLAACGSKSPTQPSPTPPTTPTPSRIFVLEGTLDYGDLSIGQSSTLTLRIRNTGNSPLAINGITGNNSITAVLKANWTSGTIAAGSAQDVAFVFTPTEARAYSATITINGDQTSGANTIAMSGRGSLAGVPIFSRAGNGNTVFDMPTYIRRVRIQGNFTGRCQNFAVKIGGDLLVNEILGTCSIAIGRSYDGTHTTVGGVVEVTISSGVNWTMTEVR